MKREKVLTIAVLILFLALLIETIYLINRPNNFKSTETGTISKRALQEPPKWTFAESAFEDPFQEMEKMVRLFRESMNRSMMDENLGMPVSRPVDYMAFEPNLDIQEMGNEYVIKMDIPGMEKDKINVEVTDQLLTISGERKVENTEEKEGSYYKMERSFGSFLRTIPLPADADSEQMSANYANGVMTIKMPKVVSDQNQKQPRKVQVQ